MVMMGRDEKRRHHQRYAAEDGRELSEVEQAIVHLSDHRGGRVDRDLRHPCADPLRDDILIHFFGDGYGEERDLVGAAGQPLDLRERHGDGALPRGVIDEVTDPTHPVAPGLTRGTEAHIQLRGQDDGVSDRELLPPRERFADGHLSRARFAPFDELVKHLRCGINARRKDRLADRVALDAVKLRSEHRCDRANSGGGGDRPHAPAPRRRSPLRCQREECPRG